MAAFTLAAGLSGGGDYSDVYTWLDPQRNCYGFGYGSLWSSVRLIHALGAVVSIAACLLGGSCTGGVAIVIVYWSGSHSCLQIFVRRGRSQTSLLHVKLPRLGMGRAQVAGILFQAKPGTGGPQDLAYSYVLATSTSVD
jgi:hypothetical protein